MFALLLWAVKAMLAMAGLMLAVYVVGFVLVSVAVLVWRHYHICRRNELSLELEWHQYALIWPLFAAHIAVSAPKDIRRCIMRWRYKCQDFWTGLTSS